MSSTHTRRLTARISSLVVFGLALLFAGAESASAQISIVVSASSSQTASEGDLAQMFGGAITSWSDGAQVQIVDQADTPVGQSFYADFIGRSVGQVRKAFTALLLSGQAARPEFFVVVTMSSGSAAGGLGSKVG